MLTIKERIVKGVKGTGRAVATLSANPIMAPVAAVYAVTNGKVMDKPMKWYCKNMGYAATRDILECVTGDDEAYEEAYKDVCEEIDEA